MPAKILIPTALRPYAANRDAVEVPGSTVGEALANAMAQFPELRKRYWGQHLWARGYFCATVGAVDEATIKAYIENQKWDDDEQGFKITAPTEP